MVESTRAAAGAAPGDQQEHGRLMAIVRGRVQGVGFRYFTRREAELLGLCGHVRNCIDGSVEVVAEGARPSLDLLLVRLREGSRGSFVGQVQVQWQEATGEYDRFTLRF